MKLFLISFGVLCSHLALIGWLQVSTHPDQLEIAPSAVQTRQILERAPAQPSATQAARHSAEQRLLADQQIKTVTSPTAPPVMFTPKMDVTTNLPLKTDTSAEDVSSPKSDKSAHTSVSSSDIASIGQANPSTGVQLPSSNAAYLNNPEPPYPQLSGRLHESGKVVVRVLIGKNGQALRGDVVQSSGFDRLDQSALKAVLGWRYVPGKVDGQAQDMWFDVPISFKLPN